MFIYTIVVTGCGKLMLVDNLDNWYYNISKNMSPDKLKSPYKAEDVAKYLIYLASQEVVGDNKEKEGMTNLKLQKVLYFAQVYFIAKLGRFLFKENIEAWKYGPVVKEIYTKFKRYSNNPIIINKDVLLLAEKDKEILKEVWDTFGGYSASRLVDIIHAHDPWKEAFESEDNIISPKLIKEYYAPLLNK